MWEQMSALIKKPFEWVDRAFSNFEWYSGSYSKYFVYGILLIALSKVFNLKVNYTKKG